MKYLLACVLSLLALPAFASTEAAAVNGIDAAIVVDGLTPEITAVGAMQIPAIVNPNGVEFVSPDNDVIENGAPKISKYTLDISTVAAPGVVVKSADLGKPALVAGKVAFTGMAPLLAALVAGDYVAVVKAEGPGGVTASVPSDPFTVKPRPPSAPGKPVWKQ